MHKKITPYKLRVYIEDTDANQIVYHANYLKYAERARTNLLRDFEILKSELRSTMNLRFVVFKAEIDYLKPAYLDDELEITTEINQITKTTITIEQEILRNSTILTKVLVKLALINDNAMPVRLPQHLHAKLSKLTARSE